MFFLKVQVALVIGVRTLALLSAVSVSACVAKVPMASPEATAVGQTLSPKTGRGAVYIFRENWFAPAVPVEIAFSGKRISSLSVGTWIRVDREPSTYGVTCVSKENRDTKPFALKADEVRFFEVTMRIGLGSPRCDIAEAPYARGAAAIAAGQRAVDFDSGEDWNSPPSIVSLHYRDPESNVRQLSGMASFKGKLGRDATVAVTINNPRGQRACGGDLFADGPTGGRFKLSCFEGALIASGTYERKVGDGNGHFVARGRTTSGQSIMLIVGTPTGLPQVPAP